MNTRSGTDAGANAGVEAPPETPTPESEETAAAKGLDAALADLRREFGEDVVTLWRASGPRKGPRRGGRMMVELTALFDAD